MTVFVQGSVVAGVLVASIGILLRDNQWCSFTSLLFNSNPLPKVEVITTPTRHSDPDARNQQASSSAVTESASSSVDTPQAQIANSSDSVQVLSSALEDAERAHNSNHTVEEVELGEEKGPEGEIFRKEVSVEECAKELRKKGDFMFQLIGFIREIEKGDEDGDVFETFAKYACEKNRDKDFADEVLFTKTFTNCLRAMGTDAGKSAYPAWSLYDGHENMDRARMWEMKTAVLERTEYMEDLVPAAMKEEIDKREKPCFDRISSLTEEFQSLVGNSVPLQVLAKTACMKIDFWPKYELPARSDDEDSELLEKVKEIAEQLLEEGLRYYTTNGVQTGRIAGTKYVED